MKMNERMKKALSALLCVSMLVQNAPVMAFAAAEDNLCDHHPEHTAACGYIGTEDSQPCHYECAECALAGDGKPVPENTAEDNGMGDPSPTEAVCNCGTDNTTHATTCPVYVAPENPLCCCTAKCTERNAWCDVCGFDETACSGTDTTLADGDNCCEAVTETVTGTIEVDAGDFDNDEAFAAYVERLFFGDSGASTFAPPAGDRLTGANKALYDRLKTEIEAIAAGTQTSTVVVFDPAEAGIPAVWTEEELGVDLLETVDGNVMISEAAQDEMLDRFFAQLETGLVLEALFNDCPYDMYWFGKEQQTLFSCEVGAGYDNGKLCGYIPSLTVVMHASRDYQGENDTTVDSSKPGTAAKAAETAKEIAAAHAGKTDYEKMLAYKDYICEAVSYNVEAVAPGYERGYGDPWQMIYVFDGDPATNVVCEGYSKAFQYLCDRSGLNCICVGGKFGDEDVYGPHMWNIVTLDGNKYLVDVTNTDEGTAGQYGELFLAGNAEGSVEGGYLFAIGGSELLYTYDAVTLGLWGASELSLAQEDYIVKPANLTAMYGDTLADITLPDGFVWQDEAATPVGNAGTNAFKVTYTRGDGDSCEVMKDVLVTVTVEKAAAEAKVISAQKHFHTYETANSMDLTGYLPADRGDTTYTLDTVTGNIFAAGTSVTNGTLSYTTKVMDAVSSGSIAVKAVMENYTDMTLTVPVELVAITAADAEQRIDQKILSEVPAGLANSSLNTVDKIEAEQRRVLDGLLGHDPQNNIAHYDVKLQYTPRGGNNWVDATPENFPKDGLTVTLPYPEGTGKDTHNFAVSHLFTTGSKAGTAETPAVKKTAEGIQFKVTGLSPVSVAWSAILYDVKIAAVTHGTVYVSPAHTSAGTQVTVTATPNSGYRLSTLTAKDAGGNLCALGATNDNAYVFRMPAADVTVTATFVRNSTATADPTNPKTGDDFHILFWNGMMVITMLGVSALLLNRKKFFGK